MAEAGRLFVDTWGWLVLANDRDPAFKAVAKLRSATRGKLGVWVTTDYVLDETITRLFSRAPYAKARRFVEGIFEASQRGLLDIEYVTPSRFGVAWRLRLKYRDKPGVSLTDFTSFAVMQELHLTNVLTGDAHFEQAGMGFRRFPGAA